MKTTSILVSEHHLIEQVLNRLERMVERCTSQSRLTSAPARNAIVFFRDFTERCLYAWVDTDDLGGHLHHTKEGREVLGQRFAESAIELIDKHRREPVATGRED